jgi:hypothetical protein
MIELGVTVIDLQEKESFDPNYIMSLRSVQIVKSMINEYNYQRIITHPKYTITSDPQNRAIYDIVIKCKTNNHYTYNFLQQEQNTICAAKLGILDLYCRTNSDNDNVDKDMYNSYMKISRRISGLRRAELS